MSKFCAYQVYFKKISFKQRNNTSTNMCENKVPIIYVIDSNEFWNNRCFFVFVLFLLEFILVNSFWAENYWGTIFLLHKHYLRLWFWPLKKIFIRLSCTDVFLAVHVVASWFRSTQCCFYALRQSAVLW